MKNKRIYIAAAAAAVLVPSALFLNTFSPSPLPLPDPYMGPLPSATSPKEMAVVALVTGVNHRVCSFRLSRGLVIRAARLLDGGNTGEAPPGRRAHRYRFWP